MVRLQSPDERTFDLNLIPEPEEEDEEMENNLAIVKPKCVIFHKAVGFRFNPTDQELLLGYLKPYSKREPLPKNKIHERNIYVYHPDQLLVEFEKSNDRDLFFFATRKGAERVSRSANGGFWHATTGRRDVLLGEVVIGRKQHFTFFNGKLVNGKPPKDGKTTWLMVEYLLSDAKTSTELTVNSVLSKIYKSNPVENQKEEDAFIINQQQQDAIQDEELWHDIHTHQEQ